MSPIEPVKSSATAPYLQVEDHEVNLQAVASNPISISHVAEEFTSDQKFYILKRLNYEGLVSLEDLPIGASFMLEKISELSVEESLEVLKEYLVEHNSDVNVPTKDYDFNKSLVDAAPRYLHSSTKRQLSEKLDPKAGDVSIAERDVSDHSLDDEKHFNLESNVNTQEIFDWPMQLRCEAGLVAYHSPYPEVRAVCDAYDDPTIPCETPRVYLVGLIWTAIGTFINQFFAQRQPKIIFPTTVSQLFIYPTGLLCALIFPKWKFKVWKYTIDMNPGPWTHKEQMLATIFFSIAGGTTSYVNYNLHVQKMAVFYNNTWVDFGYETLLILSTNFMGFGFAGVLRKFAIYPIKAIWPSILPDVALNKALMQRESKESINGWTISRYAWFFGVTAFSFVYFWIPNYLFTALSTFNWLAWIKPSNYNLATITGFQTGLGLNPWPTFDWNNINFNLCLTIPFYSYANQYVGTVIAFFAIIGVYWTNYKWTAFLPINSNAVFTNTGKRYSVTKVVTSDSVFDNEKYQKYGPPFYTAANMVVYGAFFAIYPFAIVYETFMNYKAIKVAMVGLYRTIKDFRTSTYEGFTDPHSKMMSRYKEVPEWWFFCCLIISVVLAILCVKLYPAETPVWGIFFALGINFFFLFPLTAIYSVTGFSFGLNVLVELIVGYAIPGNGLALNFIKAIGYNIDGQAQNFISDQKMGHYVKIPQRAMFRCQMLSVFVSSFITLGVINFQTTSIKDYCSPTQPQKFTCADARTFYSASVLWGVIGPKKVFGGLYPILQWCFLIGFLLSLACIAIKVYAPKKMTKFFQPTLIIGGCINYAPYNLSYYTSGLYLSFFSMYYLRKNYLSWWEKYNYIFSSGMSAGLAFSAIIIFFAVQYHEKDVSWWGNDVNNGGYDAMGVARLNATIDAPGGYFGPRFGSLP